MKNIKYFLYLGVITIALMGLVCGANASGTNPVADVALFPDGIEWTPRVEYASLVLRVSCPDGNVWEKTFEAGVYPCLDFSGKKDFELVDGGYNYELQVDPNIDQDVRAAMIKARADGNEAFIESMMNESGVLGEPLIQSGSFFVKNGLIVTGDDNESGDVKGDQVLIDDMIISGCLCVGVDCNNGENFGFDTIRLKENNLRIKFQDTSNSASFPSNDWQITANDSANGGANKFSIDDIDSGKTPFTIEAGTRANALYVDDSGRIGFGTSTPSEDLHIWYGDTPTIRLDQSGSGWAPQTWDISGNEANFFIRDATNGSKLPFRIRPGAPTNTLFLNNNGYVGIGTDSPAYSLEVETTGTTTIFALQRTDGSTAKIAAGLNGVQFGSETNHPVHFMTNSSDKRLTIATNGYVGISDETPDYPLDMGTLANGAYCTTGGVWHDASSREYKENIADLTGEEAGIVVAQLNPVKYNYKVDKEEKHVGFIAEDVPDLVASKDRKAMSAMDVVAVLTKVVQEQQKTISQLTSRMAELERKLREKPNAELANFVLSEEFKR